MKRDLTLYGCLLCTMAIPSAATRAQDAGSNTTDWPAKASQTINHCEESFAIRGSAGGRPMVPKDLFAIRKFDSTAVSPDRTMVAVVVERRAPGASSGSGNHNHRRELWVVTRRGSVRKLLTPTEPIALSQWNPVWSPNSEQLAFLSNEAKENAYLEVWDRATGRISRLTTLGVDIRADIDPGRAGLGDSGLVAWIDNHHLLALLLPAGLHSHSLAEDSRSVTVAMAGTKAAALGKDPTMVIASSPPALATSAALPMAALTILDTRTGSANVVGEVPAWQAQGAKRSVLVSPNGQWAAVTSSVPPAVGIDPQGPLSLRSAIWNRLGVVKLAEHGDATHWIEGFRPDFNGSNGYVELTWRADSSIFAVWGEAIENSAAVVIAGVEPATAKLRSIAEVDTHSLSSDGLSMEVSRIAWMPDNRMALQVRNPRSTDDASRYAWWIVSGDRTTPVSSDDVQIREETPAGVGKSPKLQTSETGRLFISGGAGHEETLFPDLNPKLSEIEEPRSISFEYAIGDGTREFADVLLPFGYRPGTRYPTVVSVYGESIRSGKGQPEQRDDDYFLNLLLLAGHGYAVLIPSMPLWPEGVPSDPMLHLKDGVDPAIEKGIALGIVDPNRLAVMGHSYGGYSVFGLVAQTDRYRAAISLMGISDLSSMYGELDPRFRDDAPNWAALAGPYFNETAQGRMGLPLWVDPERYIRNSPAFSADKITTPLLIISGDLDFLGTQSERMFTVLNRQGKRVEFVRYLGEGHTLESPANILDMWQRVFTWLDTYVKNAQVSD
jgi:acetyl esterase/lipase